MATHKPIVALFLEKEGGMSRAKTDTASRNPAPCKITVNGKTASDWHTNKGITWTTFKELAPKLGYSADCNTFAQMPDSIWGKIFKNGYWDPWNLDALQDNTMAYVIVWWSWGSGIEGARKSLEKFLAKKGIKATAKKDIAAALDQLAAKKGSLNVFMELREHRLAFYRGLSTADANYKGWLNAYDKFTDWVKTNSASGSAPGQVSPAKAGLFTIAVLSLFKWLN